MNFGQLSSTINYLFGHKWWNYENVKKRVSKLHKLCQCLVYELIQCNRDAFTHPFGKSRFHFPHSSVGNKANNIDTSIKGAKQHKGRQDGPDARRDARPAPTTFCKSSVKSRCALEAFAARRRPFVHASRRESFCTTF